MRLVGRPNPTDLPYPTNQPVRYTASLRQAVWAHQIMLYYLLVSVYVLVCLLLILVILLQQGKGGDIASAFGGGSSQAAFGARAGATLLTKMTAGLAAAFVALSLTLAVWGQRGPGSVVGGIGAPPPPPSLNLPGSQPVAPSPLPAGAATPTNQTP